MVIAKNYLNRDEIKKLNHIVDMYLDSLKPSLETQWKKIKKKPEHLVKERLSKETVLKGIDLAKKERAKYLKENPEKEVSATQLISDVKKALEEKKRKGKDTSKLDLKLEDLQKRFKEGGKLNKNDIKGMESEIADVRKEVEGL